LDNAFVRDLVDAGIHFGHRVGRWNPKMQPYIFCARNSIHIVNIKETIKGLLRSKKYLSQVVTSGLDVLFVGTKRQARQPIIDQSARCGMHYVTERWLGGTLTNFRTIRSRLGRLEELEEMEANGTLAAESKKMQSKLRREMHKIKRNLEGVRKMNRLPGLLVIIDAKREHIAIHEARKLGIPTICLIDTDSDPDLVDFPIPGNDDAMKGIDLIVGQLADAALEGKVIRDQAAQSVEEESPEAPRPSRRVTTARAAEDLAKGNEPAALEQPPVAGPVASEPSQAVSETASSPAAAPVSRAEERHDADANSGA